MSTPAPERRWIERSVELAIQTVARGAGGPFGAVVVQGGREVASGANRVLAANDPTAHAELEAIRAACAALGTYDLTGCDLYASCEPCPMCLAACNWARLARVFYAGTRDDAAAAGFDDSLFYSELALPPAERRLPLIPLARETARPAFEAWNARSDRRAY